MVKNKNDKKTNRKTLGQNPKKGTKTQKTTLTKGKKNSNDPHMQGQKTHKTDYPENTKNLTAQKSKKNKPRTQK